MTDGAAGDSVTTKAPNVVLSFEGCHTLADALAKLDVFLLEQADAMCRRVGGSLILDDVDPEDIADQLAGLRVDLAENRQRCHAWLAAMFTEDGRLRR